MLACCLIDSPENDAVSRCLKAGVTASDFLSGANRLVFEVILDLWKKSGSVSTETLAEELANRRQLDAVGGAAYLMLISAGIPTSTHLSHFIESLRGKADLRTIITKAQSMVETAYSMTTADRSDVERLASELAAQISLSRQTGTEAEFKFDDLLKLDPKADPDALLGSRYLGRGGGMVLSGPSGLGKSVLSIQLAMLFAAGIPAFGLRPQGALRVLVVQAEDDAGDVAEAVQGVNRAYALTKEQRALIGKHLRVLRWTDATGELFVARLLGEWSRAPFDLVVINPLFSFGGCDLADAAAVGNFLRHLLNPVLFRTRSGSIVVHHTKKPSADPNQQGSDETAAYDLFGSAEITNWARATISMQLLRGGGNTRCRLLFAKRGSRAGIVDAEGHPTNSITLEHAPHGLCWVPSEWKPEQTAGGKFAPKFSLEDKLKHYRPDLTWPENKRRIASALGCRERTVHDWKSELEAVA